MANRRLPIYLLVDTSASMEGVPIEKSAKVIQKFVDDLRKDQEVLNLAWLSVITFGGEARQLIPLVCIEDFQMPELKADGGSELGAALSLLCECRKREVLKATQDRCGDWHPIVVCFTNAASLVGDSEQGICDFESEKWGTYLFVTISPEAEVFMLKRINSEFILKLDDVQSKSLLRHVVTRLHTGKMIRRVPDKDFKIEGLPPLPPDMDCNIAELHTEKYCSGDVDFNEVSGETVDEFAVTVEPDVVDNERQGEVDDEEGHKGMLERRWPIYLLVDVSASMAGKPIQDVNDCVHQLYVALLDDPWTYKDAWISVITFGDEAKQVVPLTPLDEFVFPEFKVGGKTNIGGALTMLCECVDQEVRSNVHDGDFRPEVYILSDGKNDVGDFGKGVRNFLRHKWGHYAFCAIGSYAKSSSLGRMIGQEIDLYDHGLLRADRLCVLRHKWRVADEEGEIHSEPLRRQLVMYIVADISETMGRIPVDAVQLGIRQLAHDLYQYRRGRYDLQIGVVGFNDEAVEYVKPTPPEQMILPQLEPKGRANIGKALVVLSESARRNDSNLALSPMVFILSADGRETGPVDEGIARFKQQRWGRVVACAVGNGADIKVLKRIEQKNILKLKDLRPSTLLRYFDWVSDTVRMAIKNMEEIGSRG